MDDDRAIRRLITVYSQLIDDGRWDEWGQLFTEDAVFTVWDQAYTGREEIVTAVRGMQAEFPGKHVAFATVVDLDGDRALAWTDLLAVADAGPGPWGRAYAIASAARYYDQLVRVGERWCFRRRDIRDAGAPLPPGAVPSPPF
jgi:ketosteroid isomerase-like protein